MNYKNGREAHENDPVIGPLPSGRIVAGVIYGIEGGSAMISTPVPGRMVARPVAIEDLFHAEDALELCENWESEKPGTIKNPINEDDLRILRDSRLDKEAREIFPSRKTPNPKALESLGATSEKSGGIFTEQNTGTKSDWISVSERLPEYGQRVIAKMDGVYDYRECTFLTSFDGTPGFGHHTREKDGKGTQPATHWKPLNKVETECYPLTQCCAYAASTTGPHPVRWNPGNNVIQCHNCGCVYSSAAFLSANAKPEQEGPKTK